MAGKVIMVQGTSSSAGKSMLVAALCRIYARRGVKVAPFKAQNMSNNAGVCADGSEIGRAQITQAFAAGISPTAEMNPVLLKPESNMRSQVVVMGKARETLPARSYFERKQMLWGTVTKALDSLREEYDLVIVEGAGSPVELNLKSNDIVNMAIARYANAPVILVGDIDRGGIFPQLLGTLWLFPPEEQALVYGFVVNKFRGDLSLFDDGIQILVERSGKKVLGVLPWVEDLNLPEEDGVALNNFQSNEENGTLDIAVLHIPRISNFDDFDPLIQEPGVSVRYVKSPEQLGTPDAVILPGTKSTMADLQWLYDRGFAEPLRKLAERNTAVVGICGGYQMLGTHVYDPDLVEAEAPHLEGLGILPYETTFVGNKATHQASARISGAKGWMAPLNGSEITGYEIHMGRTDCPYPWLTIETRGETAVSVLDGAMSDNQQIWGCYLHGLFANDDFRRAWLRHLGWRGEDTAVDTLDAALNRLADIVESSLELNGLISS
ncbi:MAG: cobyric acid synthase [Chloroflexota bacterium]